MASFQLGRSGSTVAILSRFFAMMVVLFFLLASGDRLLRSLIEFLPSFSDKRQAATIAAEIQQIGGCLLAITLKNAAVGIFPLHEVAQTGHSKRAAL